MRFVIDVIVHDPQKEFKSREEYANALSYGLATGLDKLELQYNIYVLPEDLTVAVVKVIDEGEEE